VKENQSANRAPEFKQYYSQYYLILCNNFVISYLTVVIVINYSVIFDA